jgi:hypothetical protein
MTAARPTVHALNGRVTRPGEVSGVNESPQKPDRETGPQTDRPLGADSGVNGSSSASNLSSAAWSGPMNGSASGAASRVSSSCVVAAWAGGKCVHSMTDGSSSRKGCSEARKRVPID